MSSKRIRRIVIELGFISLLFAVTVCLQRASGAYTSAFGAEPDEASHYVTAVMIRDYILHGLPHGPVSFAKNFYLHYPRVAFGLWPPLFHILSGLWMVVFGVSRNSVMFLLAAFTVCWAWIFYRLACSVIGSYGAAISALLLVLLPETQRYTSSVMVDIPLALAMLLAMRAYGRYLISEKISDALLFGLFAALALLVKYNAFALVLLPPLCVVLTGRYHLLRTKTFWLPALVVPLIAGPWYVAARRLVLYAAEPGADRAPLGLSSVVTSATGIIVVAGPVIFGLALIGAFLISLSRHRPLETNNSDARTLFSVSAAMVLAVFLFHVFYPLFEIRYSLPAAPALIL
ncbi:MAG TPA: glycosyltransferase family 39 protein, partial [Pyrinomonadaceae bacterium]|nr:glycosyltransferase family 39 protein [Pyrinomonadaceae bacterium]